VQRRDNGGTSTACADACAAEGHDAILFGDLKDPNGPLRKALAAVSTREIREDLDLNTGVRYTGV
jgi:molybdopterin-containing oxidoreductase family iron-sulfur binding subunit